MHLCSRYRLVYLLNNMTILKKICYFFGKKIYTFYLSCIMNKILNPFIVKNYIDV